MLGWHGKVAGWEAIKNSIFTLVLLNETRSRRCVDRAAGTPENEASSHSQNTRAAPPCKKIMRAGENSLCLANRTFLLPDRPIQGALRCAISSLRPLFPLHYILSS